MVVLTISTLDDDLVVLPQDCLQFRDRTEQVYTNSSVKTCRLQQPQVLVVVLARIDCVGGLGERLLVLLVLPKQFLIDLLSGGSKVLVD